MKRLAAVVALLVTATAVAAPAPGVSVDGPVDLERLLQLTRLRECTCWRFVAPPYGGRVVYAGVGQFQRPR